MILIPKFHFTESELPKLISKRYAKPDKSYAGSMQQMDEKGTWSNHFLFIKSYSSEYLSPTTIPNY